MNKTIVSVSGYGATGSSAVVDYLKGFEPVEVLDDFEFQIHYLPDGISDLDYKLNESCSRFYDSDVAITRFLDLCRELERWYEPAFHGHLYEMAEEYIRSLNPVTWQGYWAWDRLHTPQDYIDKCNSENELRWKNNEKRRFFNRLLRKLHLPQLPYQELRKYGDFFQQREMFMSIKPEGFIEKTQQFSERLLDTARKKDTSILVVNQLLPPQNPHRYEKYFSSPVKSIVVTRDPRDLYIHVKRPKWQVVPYQNVKSFVAWYKENMKKDSIYHDESSLRLYFEDMIYEFEATGDHIKDFLGVENDLIENSSFNPQISVANTQLFKRFPEFDDDIRIIEKELADYLYDFDNHKEVVAVSDLVF